MSTNLDPATDAMLRRFAREVADLRRETKALRRAQRPAQLTHSSIDDGTLTATDAVGTEVLRVGRTRDGAGYTVEGVNGGQVLADVQPEQITETEIKPGSVTTPKLAANAVTAGKLEAVLALVSRLVSGDPNGARVELSPDGLVAQNAAGDETFRLDAGTGDALFSGDVVGGTITIAALDPSDYAETFSGTAFPPDWTVKNNEDLYGSTYTGPPGGESPGFSVTSTGVPTGSDNGSAIFMDFGPARGTGTSDVLQDYGYAQSPAPMARNVQVYTKFLHTGDPWAPGDPAQQVDVQLRRTLEPFGSGLAVTLSRTPQLSAMGGIFFLAPLDAGPLQSGIWYHLRARAFGERVEVAIWEDGNAEPSPEVFHIPQYQPPGKAGLAYNVTLSDGHTPDQTIERGLYFDRFDVTTYPSGFTVAPDGAAHVSVAEIDQLNGYPLPEPDRWHQVHTAGEPLFENGWTHVTGEPRLKFTKDAVGNVHVDGWAAPGANGSVIFTLPAGYRPDADFSRMVFQRGGEHSVGRVVVEAGGGVRFWREGSTLGSEVAMQMVFSTFDRYI